MPIRGHTGVQGSGEMGADPFVLPGGDFNEENILQVKKYGNFLFLDGKEILSGYHLKMLCCQLAMSEN